MCHIFMQEETCVISLQPPQNYLTHIKHYMSLCSGYMSPEYAVDGKFSVKSDVFSLGVLLLEIVSGRKNRTFRHPDHHHSLIGHVSKIQIQTFAFVISCYTCISYMSLKTIIDFAIGLVIMERRKSLGTNR